MSQFTHQIFLLVILGFNHTFYIHKYIHTQSGYHHLYLISRDQLFLPFLQANFVSCANASLRINIVEVAFGFTFMGQMLLQTTFSSPLFFTF